MTKSAILKMVLKIIWTLMPFKNKAPIEKCTIWNFNRCYAYKSKYTHTHTRTRTRTRTHENQLKLNIRKHAANEQGKKIIYIPKKRN